MNDDHCGCISVLLGYTIEKTVEKSIQIRPNKKKTWLASPPASRFSAASEFLKIFFYVNLFVLQLKTA
jgi:hypothetical protein